MERALVVDTVNDLILTPRSPCADMLPVTVGRMMLTETLPAQMWLVAGTVPGALPFNHAHGLLIDQTPPQGTRATDQSDAWAVVTLAGPGATDALARLATLNLRAMTDGQATRSHIGHMPGHITRIAPDIWRLMVFRSMAATLVRELTHAMHQVHARHG